MNLWKKAGRFRLHGGITVFLSLILLIMLALIGTVAESARVSVAKHKLEQTQTQALQSVFSYYAKEIWDEYGIFLLWKAEPKMNSDFNEFIEKNITYDSKSVLKHMDLLGLEVSSAEFKEIIYATDADGLHVANQIYEIMKYQITEDILNQFSSESEVLSQGSDVSNIMEQVSEETAEFQKPEGLVGTIQNSLNEELVMNQTSYEYFLDLEVLLKSMIENTSDGYLKNIKAFIEKYEAFKKDWVKQKEHLQRLIQESEAYEKSLTGTIKSFYQWKNDFNLTEQNWSADIKKVVDNEIDSVEQELCNQEDDSYGIMENKNRMDKQYQIIQDIETVLKDVFQNEKEMKSYLKKKEQLDAVLDAVETAKERSKKIDFSGFQIDYQSQAVAKEDVSFLENVKKLLTNSWLVLVADQISGKELKQEELLTTNKDDSHDVKLWQEYGVVEQLKRRTLFSRYIQNQFPDYTSEVDKMDCLLEYQMEYILGGYCSDKENLEYVSKKIFGIRTGYNLIYLLKDAKSRKEASVLATSIVGFTGMPAAVKVAEFMILSLWAQAEAIIDVRDLLNGQQVKLVKEAKDWNLSLRNIGKAFQKDEEKKVEIKKGDEKKSDQKKTTQGLSYSDYLQALLLEVRTGTMAYRTMSLIQLNMQQRYNEKFLIQNCIVGGTVQISGYIPRLFTSLGFVKGSIQNQIEYFSFQRQMEFQY